MLSDIFSWFDWFVVQDTVNGVSNYGVYHRDTVGFAVAVLDGCIVSGFCFESDARFYAESCCARDAERCSG